MAGSVGWLRVFSRRDAGRGGYGGSAGRVGSVTNPPGFPLTATNIEVWCVPVTGVPSFLPRSFPNLLPWGQGLLVAIGIVLTACSTWPPSERGGATQSRPMLRADLGGERSQPLPIYRLQVGDRISVGLRREPGMVESAVVRPDGRITHSLAGEVPAAGLTPQQLADRLRPRLATALLDPQPFVVVREFRVPRVFVAGAVRAPGAMDLAGPLTAMRAIAAAGGRSEDGALDSVLVVRQGPGGEAVHLRLDLEAHLREGADQDLRLQPGDLIFVPHRGEVGALPFTDSPIPSSPHGDASEGGGAGRIVGAS